MNWPQGHYAGSPGFGNNIKTKVLGLVLYSRLHLTLKLHGVVMATFCPILSFSIYFHTCIIQLTFNLISIACVINN